MYHVGSLMYSGRCHTACLVFLVMLAAPEVAHWNLPLDIRGVPWSLTPLSPWLCAGLPRCAALGMVRCPSPFSTPLISCHVGMKVELFVSCCLRAFFSLFLIFIEV